MRLSQLNAARLLPLAALLSLSSAPAMADVRVDFREGAPKDRFIITNTATCTLRDAMVTIDLGASAGRLIFDTTGAGAGVEVFQPFEIVTGADALASTPIVRDGQTSVTLAIDALRTGQQVVATVDVDDTIGAREITVRGSEFAGATLVLQVGGERFDQTFGTTPSAQVQARQCDPLA